MYTAFAIMICLAGSLLAYGYRYDIREIVLNLYWGRERYRAQKGVKYSKNMEWDFNYFPFLKSLEYFRDCGAGEKERKMIAAALSKPENCWLQKKEPVSRIIRQIGVEI